MWFAGNFLAGRKYVEKLPCYVVNVEEFVSETLHQVLNAVSRVKSDPRVAPAARGTASGMEAAGMRSGRMVFPVDFDIAVTVTEKTDSGGGGGIAVFGVGNLKAGVERSAAREAVSRIKFSVPLDLSMSQEELSRRTTGLTATIFGQEAVKH